jgi:Holliday junction resolvase
VRRVGQARRRDAIEGAVVDALRSIGVDVWRLSDPGVPDLLTRSRGVWLPLEVKSRTGVLTPAQIRSAAGCPIVRSVAEALALFGVMA